MWLSGNIIFLFFLLQMPSHMLHRARSVTRIKIRLFQNWQFQQQEQKNKQQTLPPLVWRIKGHWKLDKRVWIFQVPAAWIRTKEYIFAQRKQYLNINIISAIHPHWMWNQFQSKILCSSAGPSMRDFISKRIKINKTLPHGPQKWDEFTITISCF